MTEPASERVIYGMSGVGMLVVNLSLTFSAVWYIWLGLVGVLPLDALAFIIILTLTIVGLVMLVGHYTVQPNEAVALTRFGVYLGTVRAGGLKWTSPLNTTTKISLRLRAYESAKLKVNDKAGNPIEIGAVIVWQVTDSYRALFEVNAYEDFVRIQSESALRHLASSYAYDHGEQHEITLRNGMDEVSSALVTEVTNRLTKAGVLVSETRIVHLAYAPEIASVMLRRQQAEAIIAARTRIVHGAVSMVEMALAELAERKVVTFDAERKASLVANLLVVLCSETETHPVLNVGDSSGSTAK